MVKVTTYTLRLDPDHIKLLIELTIKAHRTRVIMTASMTGLFFVLFFSIIRSRKPNIMDIIIHCTLHLEKNCSEMLILSHIFFFVL